MKSNAQIVNDIKKSLNGFDLKRAIASSENEAQTRMYLVEPLFVEVLRYTRGYEDGNLVPEYPADFANLKGKKVDYAIQFKKKPEIIVEVKKAGSKLTDKELRQLNEYFHNTTDSKIGILTNGTEYRFYCRKNNGSTNLHHVPFFVVDLEKIEGDSIERLSNFHFNAIDVKAILEEAQEIFFLKEFETALSKEFCNPSKDFIKAIFNRMDGKMLTSSIEDKIKQLINSLSVRSALEVLIQEEATRQNSGIITTAEELQVFNSIKILLAQHKQIETESIGYRDQKGKFSIILNNSIQKKICDLYITPNSKKLELLGEKYDIPDIDSLLTLKKKLLDHTLSLINK